jgi:antitoxin PrlF
MHSCLRPDIPYGNATFRDIAMITSKLTSKAQTTIPQPVCAALRLQEGDELVYQIDENRVIVTKAQRAKEPDNLFRTFNEWSSDADKKAYADL